ALRESLLKSHLKRVRDHTRVIVGSSNCADLRHAIVVRPAKVRTEAVGTVGIGRSCWRTHLKIGVQRLGGLIQVAQVREVNSVYTNVGNLQDRIFGKLSLDIEIPLLNGGCGVVKGDRARAAAGIG